MKERLAPFLALLDARYLPLLFAASPQAYAVYRWLWEASDKSGEAWAFAVLGALGYEMVYVGAIAWAEGQAEGRWVWATAICALVFSIGVAVYVHADQGYAALLHAGFPIVAFAFTMTIHTSIQPTHQVVQYARPAPPKDDGLVPVLEAIEASIECPHCGAILDSPGALGAAKRWGHCKACKTRP